MLVQTNGNGGVNRYSQTQSGSLSLSGNSGAITHSYSQATGSSGGYVKDNTVDINQYIVEQVEQPQVVLLNYINQMVTVDTRQLAVLAN